MKLFTSTNVKCYFGGNATFQVPTIGYVSSGLVNIRWCLICYTLEVWEWLHKLVTSPDITHSTCHKKTGVKLNHTCLFRTFMTFWCREVTCNSSHHAVFDKLCFPLTGVWLDWSPPRLRNFSSDQVCQSTACTLHIVLRVCTRGWLLPSHGSLHMSWSRESRQIRPRYAHSQRFIAM